MNPPNLDGMDGLGQYRDEILGVPQSVIARRVGVSVSRISMLEHGIIPRKKRIWIEYARAYGLWSFPNSFLVLAERGRK